MQQRPEKKIVFTPISNLYKSVETNLNQSGNFFIRYSGREFEKSEKLFETPEAAYEHGKMIFSRPAVSEKKAASRRRQGDDIHKPISPSHGVLAVALSSELLDEDNLMTRDYQLTESDVVGLYVVGDKNTKIRGLEKYETEIDRGFIYIKNIQQPKVEYFSSFAKLFEKFTPVSSNASTGYTKIPDGGEKKAEGENTPLMRKDK